FQLRANELHGARLHAVILRSAPRRRPMSAREARRTQFENGSGAYLGIRWYHRIAALRIRRDCRVQRKTEFGMAEREGFEPPIRFPVYTLSKRAPSATRPSLLSISFLSDFMELTRRPQPGTAFRRPAFGPFGLRAHKMPLIAVY